jgi:hypothetical protein
MTETTPSDTEMITVISDFLEQGLADNIVSMFKAEPLYYHLVGEILKDERFAVRMGLVLVFEDLVAAGISEVVQAIPVLVPLIGIDVQPFIRGEAVTVLGMIGTAESLAAIAPLVSDDDPQVAEITKDFVG